MEPPAPPKKMFKEETPIKVENARFVHASTPHIIHHYTGMRSSLPRGNVETFGVSTLSLGVRLTCQRNLQTLIKRGVEKIRDGCLNIHIIALLKIKDDSDEGRSALKTLLAWLILRPWPWN